MAFIRKTVLVVIGKTVISCHWKDCYWLSLERLLLVVIGKTVIGCHWKLVVIGKTVLVVVGKTVLVVIGKTVLVVIGKTVIGCLWTDCNWL